MSTTEDRPQADSNPDHGREKKKYLIHIDQQNYETDQETLTGLQIRQIPNPPIGPDRDSWEESGHEDELVKDDEVIHIRSGMHIYTAPSTINPG